MMVIQFAEGSLLKVKGGVTTVCLFPGAAVPLFLKLIVILRSSVTTKAYLKCKQASSNFHICSVHFAFFSGFFC